jgi:hypothetical protein
MGGQDLIDLVIRRDFALHSNLAQLSKRLRNLPVVVMSNMRGTKPLTPMGRQTDEI